jgi:molybdopterin-guanine dinucleotide biosynthesis protein A
MGGSEKPLFAVGGPTMFAAVIAALGVPNIAISAKCDSASFASFGLPVLADGASLGQGRPAAWSGQVRWTFVPY